MFDSDWFDDRIELRDLNPGLGIRIVLVERGKTSKTTKTP
jgi:hypothetical protein